MIYEQIGPWLVEYVMHIPLAIIGLVIMIKYKQFHEAGGKIVMWLTIYVCLFFPIIEGLWHFVFPRLFPVHESVL